MFCSITTRLFVRTIHIHNSECHRGWEQLAGCLESLCPGDALGQPVVRSSYSKDMRSLSHWLCCGMLADRSMHIRQPVWMGSPFLFNMFLPAVFWPAREPWFGTNIRSNWSMEGKAFCVHNFGAGPCGLSILK